MAARRSPRGDRIRPRDDNYFACFSLYARKMPLPPVLIHQSGPALPLPPDVAIPVLAVGVVVCLLVAYDAYRTYGPIGADAGGDP